MTTTEAITALLTEFELETFEDVYRDEAKADQAFTGYSENYPKLRRFREVCATLRQSVGMSQYDERRTTKDLGLKA